MSPGNSDLAQRPRWVAISLSFVLLSILAWGLGYAYFSLNGPWFDDHPAYEITGAGMTVSRGIGEVQDARLVLRATNDQGLAIVSLETPALASEHYRRIRWKLTGVQPAVSLSMLWRTDFAPTRINSVSLQPSTNGVEAWMIPGEGNWIGHIQGLALTVKGTLNQPLNVESVRIEPFGLSQLFSARWQEWFHFRPWNGLSINTAIGGEDEQQVWLPVAIALVALSAIALCAAWWRWRSYPIYPTLPMAIGAVALVAWITLDARWLVTRLLQTRITATTFSGKPIREKHLADFDGEVFGFAEQIRAKLSASPARIYVTGDEPYLRGRLAYHLYPNNVYIDHVSGSLPAPCSCKPGEYVAVIQSNRVEYDPLRQLLRWAGQAPVHAELLLQTQVGALFRIFS